MLFLAPSAPAAVLSCCRQAVGQGKRFVCFASRSCCDFAVRTHRRVGFAMLTRMKMQVSVSGERGCVRAGLWSPISVLAVNCIHRHLE